MKCVLPFGITLISTKNAVNSRSWYLNRHFFIFICLYNVANIRSGIHLFRHPIDVVNLCRIDIYNFVYSYYFLFTTNDHNGFKWILSLLNLHFSTCSRFRVKKLFFYTASWFWIHQSSGKIYSRSSKTSLV